MTQAAEASSLHRLAAAAGVAREWRDIDGMDRVVADETLAAVLGALGYAADSAADLKRSSARIAEESHEAPALIVTEAGKPTPLPAALAQAELVDEGGKTRPLAVDGALPAIAEPGYYQLALGGRVWALAVAPPSCRRLAEFALHKMWGPAIQIPALRGRRAQAYGDFGDLDAAVRLFAARGADAAMINPVHALFPGHGFGYSPYSPSSRLFLNGALADPALAGFPALPENQGGAFIEWETALPRRLAALRALFDRLAPSERARIDALVLAEGEGLARHALFDALDRHFRLRGLSGWKDWPSGFHDPAGQAAQRFAEENSQEVAFHAFVQWMTGESLAAVQRNAKDAGMAIGLIADLAVGVHKAGSDSWAMRDLMLDGLSIGAPPDPLGPLGQNWTLTGFSPRGLRASGYKPFLAMLRAALTRAGGLRIDHAFGLARLWVIPDGGREGAYLTFPFEDLMRLTALESHRANALIVAEDLGVAPIGFTPAIAEKHMAGMRVMWFERAADGGFIGPQDYPAETVAMTGTHDTATVAGWWSGRDLDWAERLGRLPADSDRNREEERRAWDRGLLWSTFGGPDPRPAPDDPEPAVEAALTHVGCSGSHLALAPLEDLLAFREQPNLPGTIEEHPNWRRRFDAPLDDLLAEPANARRVAALAKARREGGPA